MLNMIIALMGDTYASVNEIQREERLFAKCVIMRGNEFLFNREKHFKNLKYIIIPSVDKSSQLN